MDLRALYDLTERLRKEAIGEPVWIAKKEAFEYQEQSAKVVAVLKLVRAAHGVSAVNLLCRSGLFIDAGAIMRCIFDCTDEIYFLLEDYPTASDHVEQFVKAFFEGAIDEYLEGETPPVPIKKIRSAVVRVLKGRHDDATQKRMERVHKTFSGYVHANYAHITEVYNGATRDFNLAGVPSEAQRRSKAQYIDVAANAVLLGAAHIAQTLGMKDLSQNIMKAVN